jgi:hypothetical protein
MPSSIRYSITSGNTFSETHSQSPGELSPERIQEIKDGFDKVLGEGLVGDERVSAQLATAARQDAGVPRADMMHDNVHSADGGGGGGSVAATPRVSAQLASAARQGAGVPRADMMHDNVHSADAPR